MAVTGIAGPDGAVPGKPVGTVWLCWAERRGRRIRSIAQRKRFRGDREAVRRKTVRLALHGIARALTLGATLGEAMHRALVLCRLARCRGA